jgi:hypothetical protein
VLKLVYPVPGPLVDLDGQDAVAHVAPDDKFGASRYESGAAAAETSLHLVTEADPSAALAV